MDNDESPGRYRIQAVAEMTGISAATLRAWERRYGVPMPKRTSAAYRVYSDHDVEIVRVVRQLCEAGMAPSQAAREVLARRKAAPKTHDLSEDAELFHLACSRILEAIVTFDSERIAAAVQRALYLGPAATVFERVFSPTLATIGERWRLGSMSIA
ncbi:MAG TPA: MerR family transcriptional regulator, partial [Nannocystis exedens]|nr:MerR family transcriptional regulator [Nannocystis exedens]